ncbi:hypothetical protein VNO77_17652 [Canavalia gladiata]|uniref:Uncharacterized protein n=1 Tax=Canavalia gladiata TaxID=3824 RepID=A0AAN9LMZ8_CANGL
MGTSLVTHLPLDSQVSTTERGLFISCISQNAVAKIFLTIVNIVVFSYCHGKQCPALSSLRPFGGSCGIIVELTRIATASLVTCWHDSASHKAVGGIGRHGGDMKLRGTFMLTTTLQEERVCPCSHQTSGKLWNVSNVAIMVTTMSWILSNVDLVEWWVL